MKYELTDESVTCLGRVLRRVRALGRHAAHFFDNTDTAARWLSERAYIKE